MTETVTVAVAGGRECRVRLLPGVTAAQVAEEACRTLGAPPPASRPLTLMVRLPARRGGAVGQRLVVVVLQPYARTHTLA